MQSEHGLPVLDQEHSSLSNPCSSTTQAGDIDNFPASIEVHESVMKKTLTTFFITDQNIEHDLIKLMKTKTIKIQSLILDRTVMDPAKYNFRLSLLKLSMLLFFRTHACNNLKTNAVTFPPIL